MKSIRFVINQVSDLASEAVTCEGNNNKEDKNMVKQNKETIEEAQDTIETIVSQPNERPIASYHESVKGVYSEITVMLKEEEFKTDRDYLRVLWNCEDVLGCNDLTKINGYYITCMSHIKNLNNERLNACKRAKGQSKTYSVEQRKVLDANELQTKLIIGYIVNGLISQDPPMEVNVMKKSGVRADTVEQNHSIQTLTETIGRLVTGANPIPENEANETP